MHQNFAVILWQFIYSKNSSQYWSQIMTNKMEVCESSFKFETDRFEAVQKFPRYWSSFCCKCTHPFIHPSQDGAKDETFGFEESDVIINLYAIQLQIREPILKHLELDECSCCCCDECIQTKTIPWAAALARWFRLRLPPCCPGFETQAHHLCFFNLNYRH